MRQRRSKETGSSRRSPQKFTLRKNLKTSEPQSSLCESVCLFTCELCWVLADYIMPKVRDTILLSFACNMIDAAECLLLYDVNSPKNPDIPYWSYERFDLDLMTDDRCKTEFRFYKNDIYEQSEILNLPDRIVCYNGVNVDRAEAFSIFLKSSAYPCRYVDLIPRFARPEPQLCMISNAVMHSIYTSWRH